MQLSISGDKVVNTSSASVVVSGTTSVVGSRVGRVGRVGQMGPVGHVFLVGAG